MKKIYKTEQQVGFIYLAIVSVFVLASLLMTGIDEKLDDLTKILTSMMFLGLAYNNHVTFKRKYFTLLYLIATVYFVWKIIIWKILYI